MFKHVHLSKGCFLTVTREVTDSHWANFTFSEKIQSHLYWWGASTNKNTNEILTEAIQNMLLRCTPYLNKLLVSSLARCKYLAPVLSWLSFTAVRKSSGTGVTWVKEKASAAKLIFHTRAGSAFLSSIIPESQDAQLEGHTTLPKSLT